MNSDVLVVGGGVLGVGVSYHLARLGLHVTLLEREATIGAHASGKNAGMLRQLYHHPQLTEWAFRTIRTMPAEVREKAFQRTGSWIVGRHVPNHHQEIFDQHSLPSIQGPRPAVHCKSDGLLDPASFVQGLFSLIPKQNLSLHLRTEVSTVTHDAVSWNVETSDGQKFSAPWLVNAAGAWLNDFLLASPWTVDAQPFARHLYVTTGWQKDFMPAADCGFYWDEALGWYMRRWGSNERLVSICDRIPTTPETYVPAATLMEEVATVLLAALPDHAEQLRMARSWHCFRTYTEDQLPIWGEDPQASGLFWLGAFGGLGMSTGFAATYDAAQHIAAKRTTTLDDFTPARVRKTLASPQRKHAL